MSDDPLVSTPAARPRQEGAPPARSQPGSQTAIVLGAGFVVAGALVAATALTSAPIGAALTAVAAVAALVLAGLLLRGRRAALDARAEAARWRTAAERVQGETRHLAEATVPEVAARIGRGEALDHVLSTIWVPESQPARALLWALSQQIAEAGARAAAAAAASAGAIGDSERLAGETLPALAEHLRTGRLSAESALAAVELPGEAALRRVVATFAAEVAASERRGGAAMAACASAAARVQAQARSMLAILRELEDRYSEDKVFQDLLELDHRMSQVGRLADNIALLAGGRTGRRWTRPISMESVIRGSIGRIQDYRRVKYHSATTVAVSGHAAEGVMHTLAELVDNAATFSPPPSDVHVYAEETDAGAVITIEDSGLGMRRHERARAEQAVAQPLDLATLTGTRLGHAVVGRLAARYGLTVSFRPSSRGGTGVVVMVPRELLTEPRPAEPVPEPQWQREPEVVPAVSGALPKRPPGQTLARSTQLTAPVEQPPASDGGRRFAAFRRVRPGEEDGADE